MTCMNNTSNYIRYAQLLVVLLVAFALKIFYSTASPDQLRWILAPTTFLVQTVTSTSFDFESHAGYISEDRKFLIAGSCAGVNFLITSFLMLSVTSLWRNRSRSIRWSFLPVTAAIAYLATIVANTARISIALQMRELPADVIWMSPNQLHRFEGVFVYFGFLLLLFVLHERVSATNRSIGIHLPLIPLVIYYATTLGVPLANGGYSQGAAFWEHSAFVFAVPMTVFLMVMVFQICNRLHQRATEAQRHRGRNRDQRAEIRGETPLLSPNSDKMRLPTRSAVVSYTALRTMRDSPQGP